MSDNDQEQPVGMPDPSQWRGLLVTTLRTEDDPMGLETAVCASRGGDDVEEMAVLLRLRGYQPMRFATSTISAAMQAQLDQRIIAQLAGELQLPVEEAGQVVADLRRGRPAINDAATAPLTFRPIVAQRDMRAYVIVSYNGQQFAQWTVDDTLQFAQHVVQASVLAPMESDYTRYLVEKIGLDLPAASAAVHYLPDVSGETGETAGIQA